MSFDAGSPALTELGELRKTFGPSMPNVVAGYILCVLMIAGGIAIQVAAIREGMDVRWNLPWFASKGHCLASIVGLVLVGFFLSGLALWLGKFVRRISVQSCEMHTHGFRFRRRATTEDVLWGDLALVQKIVTYERPPILKGPAQLLLPKVASNSYVLMTHSGKEYSFSRTEFQGFAELEGYLGEMAACHGIPLSTHEVHG